MHQALISIQFPTKNGVSFLKESLRSFPKDIEVIAVSSLYKRYLTEQVEDLNSLILGVVHVETSLEPRALEHGLSQLAGTWRLLTFDQLVSLTPKLPIPHPLLYEDKALLRCASEVRGSFEHPVLGQSLNELVRSVHSFENVEFFAQGRSVL